MHPRAPACLLVTLSPSARAPCRQINELLRTFGHENVVFRVTVNGATHLSRFYKFTSARVRYTSTELLEFEHVCAE